jgi:hypothetical protein
MAVMYIVYQSIIVNQQSSADFDTNVKTGYFYHGKKDERTALIPQDQGNTNEKAGPWLIYHGFVAYHGEKSSWSGDVGG